MLASRAETYGMVVIEALSRAIPVIATDVGGLGEALGFGAEGVRPGMLVAPDDSASLAAALRAWLADASLRARLRASRARPARVAARVVDHGLGDRGGSGERFAMTSQPSRET